MNQEKIKQQAREMAERVKPPFEFEAQFDTQAEINAYNLGFGEGKELTLRELNLESLLEDKARLDWLQDAAKSHIEVVVIATFSNNKTDMRAAGKIYYNQDSVRQAITNAMQERSGE